MSRVNLTHMEMPAARGMTMPDGAIIIMTVKTGSAMQSGFKILVIDDDESIVDIIEGFLAAHHFRPSRALDGKEGLRLARDVKPAVIILDRQMPGLDGHDVLRELKADPALAQIPVIMLTAENRRVEIEESIKLGAADYVVKPFEPEEIVERVKKIVFRHAAKKS